METSSTNNIPENVEGNIQTVENKIKQKQGLAEKEKLIRELTDMGFAKSLVLQVKYFNNGYQTKFLFLNTYV